MERLLEILNEEYRLYLEAKKYSEDKIEFVKKRDIQELKKNIEKEQNIIVKIQEVEKNRRSIIEKGNCKTLENYLSTIDDENYKQKLRDIRTKLLIIMNDLKNNNETAQKMIESSNEIINKMIETLSGKTDFGYTQTRKKSTINEKSLLNTRG